MFFIFPILLFMDRQILMMIIATLVSFLLLICLRAVRGTNCSQHQVSDKVFSVNSFPFGSLKEETRMRWFVLRFAAVLSLALISADLTFAFLNHSLSALLPSPLIATLWIPMVRHLFPGRPRISKGTSG